MVKYHTVGEETRCRHMGYSFRLIARVLLYASSHRQDDTYHSLCYTSRGALAGTRNTKSLEVNECLMTPQHKKQIGYWVSLEVNMYLRDVNLKHWSALLWRFLKGKKSVSVSRSSMFCQALEQCPKWPNHSKSSKYRESNLRMDYNSSHAIRCFD